MIPTSNTFQSWRPVVQVTGEGDKWHGNALRFVTLQEAKDSARDLSFRWMAVTAHSAEPSTDAPTHTYTDGTLKELTQ